MPSLLYVFEHLVRFYKSFFPLFFSQKNINIADSRSLLAIVCILFYIFMVRIWQIQLRKVQSNMATWNKENLPGENGEMVPMQMPMIVSASRSTDIPAFYADWFFHRLKVGYSAWTNPLNGMKGYVSYTNTRLIGVGTVPWT